MSTLRHDRIGDLALIREALLEVDIACFPDFTAAVGSACDELERFQSERSYIIGHNDGWRDALRQEVFAGTVETDSPLEAAAREAGWALMELVDEIDFRKREDVSDITSRLAKALLAVGDDQDELARARVTLAEVADWINTLPIPTRGATRMLGVVLAALPAGEPPTSAPTTSGNTSS